MDNARMFAAITTGTSFGPFFQLGIGHIFTGYDHLLFLLGLLLVCARWQTLLTIPHWEQPGAHGNA